MSCQQIFYTVVMACLMFSCGKEDDFLDGFDRQALFDDPTQTELNSVLADWASRDLAPDGYALEQEVTLTNNGTVLKMVSFNVGGNKEYGALIVPKSDVPLPIRMSIFGFSREITTNSFNLNLDDANGLPFIFAIPALRGQSLRLTINGDEYTTPTSEGEHCDAFDGAVDDAIAFLNIIANTEQNANTNRVAVTGASRGGTVALLMGQRDQRVKLANAIAAPVDMMRLTASNENDQTYQCQFLTSLADGDVALAEARQKMIASSPIFFADKLPQTQLHLAANDNIVPVEQGKRLQQKVDALGLAEGFELFIYEDRNHEDIGRNNQELNNRVRQFLGQL